MNKKLLSLLAAVAVCFSFAPTSKAGEDASAPGTGDSPESFYAAGTVTASPFASYRVHEFGKFNGRGGGGVALSYFAADNVAVEAEALSERLDDSHWGDAFTEAGVNLKGYLPLGATGFAPYGLIGYSRGGLDGIGPNENRMNAGAGLEWRATKRIGLFADGRWTHDFKTLGHALFRLGGNISF